MEYLKSKDRTKLLESQTQETILNDLLELPSGASIEAAMKQDEISSIIKDYNEFKETIRQGDMGKTARLWITYMAHVWLNQNVTRAVTAVEQLLWPV